MYQILHMKSNIYVHYVTKDLKKQVMKTQFYHIMQSIQMQFLKHFLKALNQRAEYVCTCWHHMLFCKTMQQFHIKDYDISNETVKKCLSHQYVMKLYRHTSHKNDDMTTHKWPQFVPDDVEHDDIYVINEVICIH